MESPLKCSQSSFHVGRFLKNLEFLLNYRTEVCNKINSVDLQIKGLGSCDSSGHINLKFVDRLEINRSLKFQSMVR